MQKRVTQALLPQLAAILTHWQLKRDWRVLAPYVGVLVGLCVAAGLKWITVETLVLCLGLLNMPAALGLRKDAPGPDAAPGAGEPPAPGQLPRLYDPAEDEETGSTMKRPGGPVVALLVLVVLSQQACIHKQTPEEKAVTAEATYRGELLRCVDKSATREAYEQCRGAVKARWDAGAPE